MNTTFTPSLGFGNGAFGARRVTRTYSQPTPNPGFTKISPGAYVPPSKRTETFDASFPPLSSSATTTTLPSVVWSNAKNLIAAKAAVEAVEETVEKAEEADFVMPLPRVDSYLRRVAERKAAADRQLRQRDRDLLSGYSLFKDSYDDE